MNNYPDFNIKSRREPVKKQCRLCGKTDNLVKDELSKDWWHEDCHAEIIVLTQEDVRNYYKTRLRKWF